MTLNDPNTNWAFVGVVVVAGLATAGFMMYYL